MKSLDQLGLWVDDSVLLQKLASSNHHLKSHNSAATDCLSSLSYLSLYFSYNHNIEMMQKGHNQKSPLLANQGTFPSPQTNFTTSKWRKSTLNASSTNPAENPETINTTNYPKVRQRKAANSKDHPTMNCRTPISMQSKQTFQPENNHHERDHLQTHLQGQKRAACQEKQPAHHVPFL